jgi:hypothetical protein
LGRHYHRHKKGRENPPCFDLFRGSLILYQSNREKQAAERKCGNEAEDLVHFTVPFSTAPNATKLRQSGTL